MSLPFTATLTRFVHVIGVCARDDDVKTNRQIAAKINVTSVRGVTHARPANLLPPRPAAGWRQRRRFLPNACAWMCREWATSRTRGAGGTPGAAAAGGREGG